MTQTEALKLALDALELHAKQYPHMQKGYTVDAITALRTAIEQAEKQEPVFWYRPVGEDGGYEGPLHNGVIEKVRKECGAWKPLYTTPPQRKPLTDEEIKEAVLDDTFGGLALLSMMRDEVMIADVCQAINRIARAIEAAHGIKGEA